MTEVPTIAPIPWPASCYPPAVMKQYRALEAAPGHRALRGLLPRYLRPGIRVLDIGCGVGIGACHIAASGGQGVTYTGFDPDAAACRQAREVLDDLPRNRIRGDIRAQSLEEYLATNPSPVDVILWTFSFHDCVSVAEEQTHAALCASVAALVLPGGQLVLMDGCFAPGVSADEVERTYEYMARIIGHCDRGRYFPAEKIAGLFTGAGLDLVERHDVPLMALARYLDLSHARAALFVFGA